MSSTSCNPSHGQAFSSRCCGGSKGRFTRPGLQGKSTKYMQSPDICGVYPLEVVLDFATAPPNLQHMHMHGACSGVATKISLNTTS